MLSEDISFYNERREGIAVQQYKSNWFHLESMTANDSVNDLIFPFKFLYKVLAISLIPNSW